jgi:hypothetical protein
VLGAVFILATKFFQVVHDHLPEIQVLAANKVRRDDALYRIPENVSILIDHKEILA